MEYCYFGSCGDIMSVREQPYKEKEIAVICKDVLRGLSYVHALQRIHRDIKADNIMVNNRGEMKLGLGEIFESMFFFSFCFFLS